MSNAKNQSQNWLHDKLAPFMGPALLTLIGSSIFRGLLGIAIASLTGAFGTYSHWSPFFRLPVEMVVFLGVFISGDICYANGVGNVEGMKKRQVEILNEDTPKFKGDASQQTAQALAYQKGKDARLAFAKEEIKTERQARNTFGFISASYAINFIIQSAIPLNDFGQAAVLIFIDVESVFATFFVIWYYAARFKADKTDPAETGVTLVETAMEKRLEKVSANFEAGEPTEEDLNLADVALPARHAYKKFVPALRKMPAINEIMTTKAIFIALGVNDPTTERAIRRTIKAAYDKHIEGVFHIQQGSKQEWRVSGAAFFNVLGKFLPGGESGDNRRTSSARQRPQRFAPAGQPPVVDQTPAVDATAPETPADVPTTPPELPNDAPAPASDAPAPTPIMEGAPPVQEAVTA